MAMPQASAGLERSSWLPVSRRYRNPRSFRWFQGRRTAPGNPAFLVLRIIVNIIEAKIK